MERIFNLIKAKFPEHEITPLSGGGTNALYLLERNGIRTVLKIAMISNFNAGVEEECLHILNRSRFAPRLYERFEIDRRTSLRIEYIEGPSYLSLILERLKDADVGKIFPLGFHPWEVIGRTACSTTQQRSPAYHASTSIPRKKTR